MANKKRELVAGSRHAAFILLCQEKKGEGSIELKHGALAKVAKFFKTMETTMCHYPTWEKRSSPGVESSLSVSRLWTRRSTT